MTNELIEAMGFEIENTACVDQQTAENAARAALAAAEAAGYRMVPDTPVAWTYPEELACMLDDPEHIGWMWSEPSGDGNDIALYAAAPEVGRD